MKSSTTVRTRRSGRWPLRPSVLLVLFLVLALAASSIYMGGGIDSDALRLSDPQTAQLPIGDEPADTRDAEPFPAITPLSDPAPTARPGTAPRRMVSLQQFTVAVAPLRLPETDRATALSYRLIYDQFLAELAEMTSVDLLVLDTANEEFDREVVDFLLELNAGTSLSREQLANFRVDWTAIRGGRGSWLAAELEYRLSVESIPRAAALALSDYPFPPEDGTILALEAVVLNSSFSLDERLLALKDLRLSSDRYAFVGRDERRQVSLAAVEIVNTVPDPEIRGHTWRAMMGLEDPWLVAPLTDTVLQDPSEFVRIEAVKLLSADYSDVAQAQSALQYALVNDLSSRVRMHARWESLNEADRQAYLASTLLDTGLSDAERFELLQADVREIRRYLDRPSAMALADISSRARPTAQGPLASESTGDVSAADVIPLLVDMMEDQTNEAMIRSTMVASLARHLDEPGVREALSRTARNDPSDRVRMDASMLVGSWMFQRRRIN